MKLWIARLLVGVLVFGAAQLLMSTPAYACDPEQVFTIRTDHVASADLNEPNSVMAQEFGDFYFGQERSVPQLSGGYLLETTQTIEPEDDWTRGSVSVVTKTWGAAPSTFTPVVADTVDLSVVEVDTCGEPSDGPALGTLRYFVVTDEGSFRLAGDQPEQALATAFGEPLLTERDAQAEERLIAALGTERSGSSPLIAIAIGVSLIGVGTWLYRQRKT